MMIDLTGLAKRQLSDSDAVQPGTLFAEPQQFTEEQAYAIQAEVCRLREQRGETVIGYKVGCTSPGIQQQLGIEHPVFGRLLDSGSWLSGQTLSRSRFDQLAIEGELAVQLATGLSPTDTSEAAIRAAIETVFPVIELHHFVFRGSQPSAVELIANNAIHAGFVRPPDPAGSLANGSGMLRIEMNGIEMARMTGEESLATVIDSLQWLVQELANHGIDLEAGQVVLCGSVADLFPMRAAGQVTVSTERAGTVACKITDDSQERGERT
ncbi:MAG: hypothetical protein ABGX05_16040 [Pirellulaceae bacterium]